MASIPNVEDQPPHLRFSAQYAEESPWLAWATLLTILGAVLLVMVVGGLLMAYQGSYAGRIVPGITIDGVSVGGMTPDEAQAVLERRFTYDDSAVFTFRDGEKFWQVTAGELGVRFDAAGAINEAFARGRGGDAIGDLVSQGLIWLNGEAISPNVIYDQSAAVARLQAIGKEIDHAAVNGHLVVSGQSITAVPGQTGRVLDITATLAALDNNLLRLNTGGEIPLVISEMSPSIVGVELAEARARAALSGPLSLTADDGKGGLLGPWTISVDQIAALLNVELVDNGDGTKSYAVNIDFSAFEGYLNELAPGLVTQPVDARFHFNEVTRQLEVIKPASGGRSLDVARTLEELETKVFSTSDRTTHMVFNYVQPRYHNNITAQELGITEMVVEATTYFTGSPANRRTNIAVGAALYDGIIIGPGEEFSFNYWLGDLSEEAGFTEGNVIFGGRTIQGIGGGICQVSTTIFRAAFLGGYTIIERNSHGYRVGYYEQAGSPPGLDAAIWTPERDFRFQNDTPHHLLIQVSVFPTSDTLQFKFYSTSTGRQVEILPVKVANVVPAKATIYEANDDLLPGQVLQVDYAAEGADVNVTRVIRDAAGNEIRRDNVFTHYLPWGAIYQVAPGDARLGQ